MRTLLFASAAVLALGGPAIAPAWAQNAAGNPRSAAASNITGTDTHSELAPALPSPGTDMTPDQLLNRANQDLRAGRTGAAQEALEEAETRLLDRSTAPSQAGMPDTGPRIDAIRRALHALASRDRAGAMQGIQMAMSNGGMQGNGMSGNSMSGNGMSGNGDVGNGMSGNGMSGNGMSGNGMSGGGMGTMPASGGTSSPVSTPPGSTMPPNGMVNNPAGQSGGGGNESSGPAQ